MKLQIPRVGESWLLNKNLDIHGTVLDNSNNLIINNIGILGLNGIASGKFYSLLNNYYIRLIVAGCKKI